MPALEHEQGPRLSDALEMEDRIAPVVRRDPLARDDMKIALAVGSRSRMATVSTPTATGSLRATAFRPCAKLDGASCSTALSSSVAASSSAATALLMCVSVLVPGWYVTAATLAHAHAEEVIEALRIVEDPELGMDIVELGLLYDVAVDGSKVHVTYSLTSMGCPVGPMLEQQINETVAEMDGRRRRRVGADLGPAVDTGEDVRRRQVHPRLRLAAASR